MSDAEATQAEISELIALLEQRLAVIGDADMRENDPNGQLEQLKQVSESIMEMQKQLEGRIPFRLGHFLERCSYDKALDWAREMRQDE